jgi:hypothetical protein
MARFRNRYRHTVIDYKSYQMSHSVSIPMIFVSAIFACATLTGKMVLTAKMCELHLLPKWRPMRVHKKSRRQFWLSDSSGIIYHLWYSTVMGHSRKHPYHPHGGTRKLTPLPPSDVLIHLLLSETIFLPSPSGRQKFPPWGEYGSFLERPNEWRIKTKTQMKN